jgi:hypothetical protein
MCGGVTDAVPLQMPWMTAIQPFTILLGLVASVTAPTAPFD